MHHDYNIRIFFQGQPVTGFLVPPIAEIVFLNKNFCPGRLAATFAVLSGLASSTRITTSTMPDHNSSYVLRRVFSAL